MLYSVVECNSGILVAVQYVNRCWGGGVDAGCYASPSPIFILCTLHIHMFCRMAVGRVGGATGI